MIDANKFCVYIHELPDGRKYIGMTSRKPEHRFHKDGSGYRNNIEFYSEIQKIGWENIKHIIVISGLSLQEAAQLEIELIREYETTNPENWIHAVLLHVGIGERCRLKITVGFSFRPVR